MSISRLVGLYQLEESTESDRVFSFIDVHEGLEVLNGTGVTVDGLCPVRQF